LNPVVGTMRTQSLARNVFIYPTTKLSKFYQMMKIQNAIFENSCFSVPEKHMISMKEIGETLWIELNLPNRQ